MSKVTEMAKAEAEAAEAEDAESTETTDAEDEEASTTVEPESPPETEPESDEPPEPDTQEAMRRAIEGEAKRHYNALAKLMPGFEDTFTACPLCESFGYIAGTPFPADPTRERCDQCAGLGATDTDSLVEGHRFEQCTKCQGNGWVTKAYVAPPVAVNVTTPQMATGNGTTYEPPEVAQLRAAGYVIVPPVATPVS